MAVITNFLTKNAIVFNIDRSTTTPTGQPIELLVKVDEIKVFFTPKPKKDFQFFGAGQVAVASFFALGLKELNSAQVIEILNVKYRIVAVSAGEFKRKIFFFKYHLELFQH